MGIDAIVSLSQGDHGIGGYAIYGPGIWTVGHSRLRALAVVGYGRASASYVPKGAATASSYPMRTYVRALSSILSPSNGRTNVHWALTAVVDGRSVLDMTNPFSPYTQDESIDGQRNKQQQRYSRLMANASGERLRAERASNVHDAIAAINAAEAFAAQAYHEVA